MRKQTVTGSSRLSSPLASPHRFPLITASFLHLASPPLTHARPHRDRLLPITLSLALSFSLRHGRADGDLLIDRLLIDRLLIP